MWLRIQMYRLERWFFKYEKPIVIVMAIVTLTLISFAIRVIVDLV